MPYSLTEEFAAVYRMHPLMPDDYNFRSAADDRSSAAALSGLAGPGGIDVFEASCARRPLLLVRHPAPGAVMLHNFPRVLQEFVRPDGQLMDLAAVDILRSRELGVPRYNEFRRLLHLDPARTSRAHRQPGLGRGDPSASTAATSSRWT